MQPEDNETGQIPDNFRHGDGNSEQPPLGIGRSIRSGVSMPPTVLVTEMDNGALILQGRPDERRVYLSRADAVALRRELARAFGSADVRCASEGIPRTVSVRVSVRGMKGVTVTVVITVQQGHVWLSIQQLFTWEAIMEPGKIDELIHVLGLARDEAEQMERDKRTSRGDRKQPAGTGTVLALPGHTVESDRGP